MQGERLGELRELRELGKPISLISPTDLWRSYLPYQAHLPY